MLGKIRYLYFLEHKLIRKTFLIYVKASCSAFTYKTSIKTKMQTHRLLLLERNFDAGKVQIPVLLPGRHFRAPQLRRRLPAPQHIRLRHPGHLGEIVHGVSGGKLQKFFRREQVPAVSARLLLPARFVIRYDLMLFETYFENDLA